MRRWIPVFIGSLVVVAGAAVALAARSSSKHEAEPFSDRALRDALKQVATVPTNFAFGGGSPEHPAAADVSITSCVSPADDDALPTATVAVRNHSSEQSNYFVRVAFESPDHSQQLDTVDVSIDNLAPGQTRLDAATSTNAGLRGQPFSCRVADVIRLAA